MAYFIEINTTTNQIIDVLDDNVNTIPGGAIEITKEQLAILNNQPSGFSMCDYVAGNIVENAARTNSYNLDVCICDKVIEIKNYALGLINSVIPGLKSFDDIGLAREQWLSIAAASRTPTVNFQYTIDVYQAAKGGIATVQALTTVADVTGFDPETNITWPVAP